jgi:signal transduction histidine kinase
VKVRTRLVLAFAYILLTVIVALTVPLAFNLRARAVSELVGQAKVTSQALAAVIGAEALDRAERDQLQARAEVYSEQIDGRVLILNAKGVVLADANPFPDPPDSAVGQNYNTPERQEIGIALNDGQPEARIRRSEELGYDIMVAAAPIIDDTSQGSSQTTIAGAVRITSEVQTVTDAVRNITIGIIVIGLGGLLAGMLIAFGLAGSLARPLTRLAATAKRLGDGDLTARAGDIKGPREVEDLATSFDEMADRVERTFEAQRSFVANASHQLRTPLTGMKLRIERAADDATDPQLRRQLQAADQDVDRMAATVDRMLEMARDIEEGMPAAINLHAVATDAAERWRDRAAAGRSTLTVEGVAASSRANPTDVEQLVDNVIDNAIHYAPGPIEIEAGHDDGLAFIAIRDHGTGIPQEERSKVTERFYRGKGSPPGGSGLGLAIARDLAEKWGGTLTVESPPDGGTRVEARFPNAHTGGEANPPIDIS